MEVRRSARGTGLRRHPGGRGRGLTRRSTSSAAAYDERYVGRHVTRRVFGSRGPDARILRCLTSRMSHSRQFSTLGEVQRYREGAQHAPPVRRPCFVRITARMPETCEADASAYADCRRWARYARRRQPRIRYTDCGVRARIGMRETHPPTQTVGAANGMCRLSQPRIRYTDCGVRARIEMRETHPPTQTVGAANGMCRLSQPRIRYTDCGVRARIEMRRGARHPASAGADLRSRPQHARRMVVH